MYAYANVMHFFFLIICIDNTYLKREYIESVLLCCPLKKYKSSVMDDPNMNKSP